MYSIVLAKQTDEGLKPLFYLSINHITGKYSVSDHDKEKNYTYRSSPSRRVLLSRFEDIFNAANVFLHLALYDKRIIKTNTQYVLCAADYDKKGEERNLLYPIKIVTSKDMSAAKNNPVQKEERKPPQMHLAREPTHDEAIVNCVFNYTNWYKKRGKQNE